MKKTLSVLAVIAAICLTAGRALEGAKNLWYGVASLWDFLIVIVFVALLVYLVRLVVRRTKQQNDSS